MSLYRFGSAVARNPFSALTKCFGVAVLGAAAALAVPCPTATFDVYVAFGTTGCTIGSLTFSQFKYLPFGNTIIPPTNLLVTPIVDLNGTGFMLTPQGVAWFATFFGRTDIEIMYIAKSTNPINTFSALYTQLDGFFNPPGFDQIVELYCPGGTTLPPDQVCPLIPPGVRSLYAGLGKTSVSFPNPVNSIAVLKDIDANALMGGNATITSVKNQLNVTCVCQP